MSEEPDIVCKVTPWYYRRMGLMGLMFAVFAAWFYYDGKIGWPKKNIQAYEHEVVGAWHDTYDEFKDGEKLEEWPTGAPERVAELVSEENQSDGRTPDEILSDINEGEGGSERFLDEEGLPIKWAFYAADRGWGEEEPKYHTKDDVAGQFRWAGGALLFGLAIGVLVLLNRGKKLQADREAYITDKGERIPFASVFEVDTRKWGNKGLAYFRYRDGAGEDGAEEGEGEARKGVIDDLKYGGGQKILDRMLENFEGDLIEAVPDEEDEEEDDEAEESADEAEEATKGA